MTNGNKENTGVEVVPSRLVFRWDLDKTLLRTEFDTLVDLLRTAFEGPARKRTIPGAAALLREQRAIRPAGIFILSGSPEQMRRTLEARLRLDGVQWDAFTLKPSLSHLLRGRLRFLRDQVGYKLEALLTSRIHVDPDTDEMLFGDDAEADAFAYSLYADLCEGTVSSGMLLSVLQQAGVYEDRVSLLQGLSQRLPPRRVVRRIFIHLDRVSPVSVFREFGPRVFPFHNYFEPSWVLLEQGILSPEAVLRVGTDIVVGQGFSPDALAASLRGLVRRNEATRPTAERFLAAVKGRVEAPTSSVHRAFEALFLEIEGQCAVMPEELPRRALSAPLDYGDLFRRENARVRRARSRARRRWTD